MEQFIELLKEINIAQIAVLLITGWYGYSRLKTELKNEISQLKIELKSDINSINARVEDVDKRLCRIEGSLSTQGHCLFTKSVDRDKIAS